jgi:hypothetical protein
MRPVSSRWAATIPAAHQLSIAATVLDPDGNNIGCLTPTDGNVLTENGCLTAGAVTLDGKADTRGSLSLGLQTLGSLVPKVPSDLLAPYVNEIKVERGFSTPEGYVERVGLGIYRIETVDTKDDLSISITGYDRSKRFVDATFEEAASIPDGTNFAIAIELLLRSVWPDVPLDFTATAATTPLITLAEGDSVWEAATALAEAIGMVLYFDGDGIGRLVPYAPGSAVATIGEGDGGTLLDVSQSWSRAGAFNRVVVTGENPANTEVFRSVALDEDPFSATYYYGDFGKISRDPYTSPYIVSQEQADDAAAAILAQGRGTTQLTDFGAIVNAALEPNDVVRIKRSRLGLDADLVIDTLQIPLDAETAMSGTTRAVLVQ